MASPFVVSPELDEGSNHERKVALRQAQGERIWFQFSEDGFFTKAIVKRKTL
jgi:hypothetical protein